MNPFIIGPTGRKIDLIKPDFDLPTDHLLLELGEGLAREHRFSNHTLRPYSVAEHSILVSVLGVTPASVYYGIFHDASEAYLRDIPKPLKSLLPDYQAIEARFELAIYERLAGEPLSAEHQEHYKAKVKNTDWNASKLEMQVLGFGVERYTEDPQDRGFAVDFLDDHPQIRDYLHRAKTTAEVVDMWVDCAGYALESLRTGAYLDLRHRIMVRAGMRRPSDG